MKLTEKEKLTIIRSLEMTYGYEIAELISREPAIASIVKKLDYKGVMEQDEN